MSGLSALVAAAKTTSRQLRVAGMLNLSYAFRQPTAVADLIDALCREALAYAPPEEPMLTAEKNMTVLDYPHLGVRAEVPGAGTMWRHLKSERLYRVIGSALREEDKAVLVLYRRHAPGSEIWARPLPEFMDGRFFPEGL